MSGAMRTVEKQNEREYIFETNTFFRYHQLKIYGNLLSYILTKAFSKSKGKRYTILKIFFRQNVTKTTVSVSSQNHTQQNVRHQM